MRLLYAELLKLRTAPRTLIGLTLALVAVSVLGAASTASDGSPIGNEFVLWDVLSVGTTSAVFSLILGILIVTWEYRHGTITQTFLITPQRERVLIAKYAVGLVAGAVLAGLCLVVVLATAQFWISIDLTRGQWELMGRIAVASALWGVFGAGLGALLQSQVGAIVAAFVWFLVAEPLFTARFEHFGDYLPGSTLDRLTERGALETGEVVGDPGQGFSFGLYSAALLAVAYAVGMAALGIASALRRDIS